jgi:XRE family aerobic/anaerobic benzoate catabolism transcriptional regulator
MLKPTEAHSVNVLSLVQHQPRTRPEGQKDSLAFLARLGDRVRDARKSRGLSRRVLSDMSGVSERYLAQLEGGSGNISIVLLRDIALSLGVMLEDLVSEPDNNRTGNDARASRLALVGLRGAGKSTLGKALARRLGFKFVELNDVIRELSGLPISELFNLYGQDGYRRFEAEAIDLIATQRSQVVLAVAGGIVADEDVYETLLKRFHTIWLKASPEEHMSRVRAQGDLRPMEGNPEAMVRLRQLLGERMKDYARAHYQLDTSGQDAEVALDGLLELACGRILPLEPDSAN